MVLYALACHGKKRVEQRRERAENDASAMARVETEDEQYPDKCYHAQHQFARRETPMSCKRFDDCRKEAVQGDAHHGDAHVRSLNAGIEQCPVYRQQHPAEANP